MEGNKMTCANYGCTSSPIHGFPCCSGSCGFAFKNDKATLKSYQSGELEIEDLTDGQFLKHSWPLEKAILIAERI